MKKTALLILTIYFGLNLHAQKINTEPVRVSYTQLPYAPLPAEFSTYSTYIVASNYTLENIGMTKAGIAKNYFRFSGYKYLERGGHFNIQVKIGWFSIVQAETKRKESKTKDKEGNEKVTVRYEKNVKYSMPMSYVVRDHKGNTITERVIATRENIQSTTFTTGSTRSYVDQKWRDGRAKFIARTQKNLGSERLKSLGSSLRAAYDFRQFENVKEQIELVKKSNEEAGFKTAYETINATFAKMKADQPVKPLLAEAKPAIEYWESVAKKYDPKNKKERKVVHAALYNLATTYYWLDDFSLARTYANRCIKDVKWKEGKLKGLVKSIDRAEELMAKNGMDTRHIYRDLSAAVSPAVEYEMAVAEEQAAQEANIKEANTERFVGLRIDDDGNQIMGEFSIDQTNTKELLFGEGGNVKFMVNSDGNMTEQSLEPNKTTTFAFNDRQFMYLDFQPSHKIVKNEAAAKEIMEVLYEGKHISVYKFHPRTDKGKPELAIKKTSEAMPSSLKGAQFIIFKSGLAKYFEDCPTLSEQAGSGKYSNSEEDVIKAAKLYNSECVKP